LGSVFHSTAFTAERFEKLAGDKRSATTGSEPDQRLHPEGMPEPPLFWQPFRMQGYDLRKPVVSIRLGSLDELQS